jgi:hypothetical protein
VHNCILGVTRRCEHFVPNIFKFDVCAEVSIFLKCANTQYEEWRRVSISRLRSIFAVFDNNQVFSCSGPHMLFIPSFGSFFPSSSQWVRIMVDLFFGFGFSFEFLVGG